ncbi:hypothetical protein QA596_06845 [Balneolales bacterium ANBcel1]|nr:hypothetical protein [Balneolales bacterium ANBcel1]
MFRVLLIAILMCCQAILPTGSGGAAGLPEDAQAQDDAGSRSEPHAVSNSAAVACQTADLMLGLLDDDGTFRTPAGGVIAQPVFLEMDAPVQVKEHLLSELMAAGIRIAGEPAHHHKLQIEWRPENLLIRKGSRSFSRILRSEVYFTWMDEEREVREVWKSSYELEEAIPPEVADAPADWEPAAFQQRKDSRRLSFLNRIAEPAIITGAVTVTIYLLYSVRR